jgi:hypothetical protein
VTGGRTDQSVLGGLSLNMGLVFAANMSAEDFVPPSGLGKGKGKSRVVTLDGVVDSPESVGPPSSTRVQKKRRRKLLQTIPGRH